MFAFGSTFLGLLAVVVSAGCSAASTQHRSSMSKPGGSEDYNFPLSSYLPTADQRSAEAAAKNILTNRCAAEYGISLSRPTKVTLVSSLDEGVDYNVRPTTVEGAKALGYHVPTSPSPPVDHSMDHLTPTERLIVGGWIPGIPGSPSKPKSAFILSGGCGGQAARAIEGPKASAYVNLDPADIDLNYILGLIQESTQRAEASAELVGKVGDWSACMATHGYPNVTTLLQVIRKFDLNGPLTTAERDEAIQDATCKSKIGMMDLWKRLVLQNQKQLIAENAQQLSGTVNRLKMRIQKAANVIAHQ